MADGYTVFIEEPLASRLRAEADASGVSIDVHVRARLEQPGVREEELEGWEIDEAIAQRCLAAGDGIPLEDYLPRLERFGKRSG